MRVAPTNASIIGYALRGEDARTGSGNMSTDSFRVGFSRPNPYTGHLPDVWNNFLESAFQDGRISQVIYSYSTPIAWRDEKYGWVVPAVTYSVTTSSKHQTHLYKLRGRRIFLPWDASAEEAQRVMDGKMIFTTLGRWDGKIVCTIPGPNYVAGE